MNRALTRARPRRAHGLYPKGQRTRALAARKLPTYLDHDQVNVLIRCAPTPVAAFLFLIQWRAGLRISEALALEPRDVHLDGEPPTLVIRHGKGNRQRLAPLHAELAAAIRLSMAYHRPNGPFIPCSRSTAWRWIQQAYAKAVDARLLPEGMRIGTHTLRHSAARHWMTWGKMENQVQLWLGHASPSTTRKYLALLPSSMGDISTVP